MSPFWVKPGRAAPLPIITAANKGLGIDSHIVSGGLHPASWATVIRVDNVENRTHTQKGLNGGGRYRKEKSFLKRSVGKQFRTHGGRFGRAMIKYPHTKKNAQGPKRSVYPGSRPPGLTVK